MPGADRGRAPLELTVSGAAGGKRREETWRVVRAVGAGESAEVFEVETPRGRRALKWAKPDFEEVIERGASDLHITAGERPKMRIDGDIIDSSIEAVRQPKDTMQLAYSVLTENQKKRFEMEDELDF